MADVIKQRIALEGVQEIAKQLRDLGATGEQAFKQIQAAVEKQQLAKPADELRKVGDGVRSLAEQLRELAGGGGETGGIFGSLGSVAAAALNPITAAIGGLVGAFALLGKGASDEIVKNDQLAHGLGLTYEQYIGLQKAAREAGVEQDKFLAGMTKLARQIDTEGRQQFTSLIDVVKAVVKSFGEDLPPLPIKFIGPNFQKIRDQFRPVAQQIRTEMNRAADEMEKNGDIIGAGQLRWKALAPDDALIDRIMRLAGASDELRKALEKIGTAPPPSDAIQALDQMVQNAQPTFAALGISLLDTNGKLKDNYQVFTEWAQKISEIKDPAEQARRVMEMFPRSIGPEMVKFLQEGTHSTEEWIKKLRELGQIPTEKEIADAKEAHKAWDELGNSFDALKLQIGQLAQDSGFTGLLNLIADGVGKLAYAFKDLREFFSELKTLPQDVAAEWQRLIDLISRAIEKAKQLFRPSAQPSGGAIQDAIAAGTAAGGATGGLIEGNTVRRFMSGGLIRGPGTGTSDSILGRFSNGGMIRVSNGEYIVRAAAVKHLGLGFLNSINRAPGYAMGGLLDSLALPRFEKGGLATAGGGHWGTVDLRTNHGDVPVMVQRGTMQQLSDKAIQNKITRGGRRQSWYTGP